MAIGHPHPLHAYQIGARGSSTQLTSFVWLAEVYWESHSKLFFSLKDLESHSSSIDRAVSISTTLPLLLLYCALWWAGGSGGGPATVVMEFTSKQKAVLLLCFFMLSCLLLLPRASSAAPLSSKHPPDVFFFFFFRCLSISCFLTICCLCFAFAGSLSLTNRQLPTKNPALEVPAQQVGRACSIAISFCSCW